MKYYPIIIFYFNRLNHLKKLLDSIDQNKNYNQHKSFLFKVISSNNINRHIQTIHRPSIKFSIKYLLKRLT